MRVVVIARGLPTEATPLNGLFEFDQAKALCAIGHEVIYAVVDLRSIRRKRKLGIQQYKYGNLKVFSIAVPVGAVPTAVLDFVGKWAIHKLYCLIERECGRPDVVHAHFLDMGVLAADLCSRKNLPLVITEHSSELNQREVSSTVAKRAKIAYSRAGKVVAVSSALASKIKSITGIEAVVVPNVVDTMAFSANVKQPGKSFRFISAASLNKGKGFDVLLRAFAEYYSERNDAELIIMGDGPEKEILQQMAIQLGIEDTIRFWGSYSRPELAEELSKSDAFILASRGETFGLVYAEAMSAGLPVIATCCGGPEDFVNASNGILVPVDDVAALKNAMRRMAENIQLYDNVAISEVARKTFSAEAVGERLTLIYCSISESFASDLLTKKK